MKHTRDASFLNIEVRADENQKPLIRGIAAVYDSPSEDFGGFYEVIDRGCFTKTLNENKSIKSVWNHKSEYPLGSQKNGSLVVTDTPQGIAFACNPPDTQYAKDATEAIRSGLCDQCSFIFEPVKTSWSQDPTTKQPVRHLVECKLYSVDPVTFPAYPATSVGYRSEQITEVKEDLLEKIKNAKTDEEKKLLRDLVLQLQIGLGLQDTDEEEEQETEPANVPLGPDDLTLASDSLETSKKLEEAFNFLNQKE